jgi:uncharacterized membrane protein
MPRILRSEAKKTAADERQPTAHQTERADNPTDRDNTLLNAPATGSVHGSFTLSWGFACIRDVLEWVAALMVVVAVVHRVFPTQSLMIVQGFEPEVQEGDSMEDIDRQVSALEQWHDHIRVCVTFVDTSLSWSIGLGIDLCVSHFAALVPIVFPSFAYSYCMWRVVAFGRRAVMMIVTDFVVKLFPVPMVTMMDNEREQMKATAMAHKKEIAKKRVMNAKEEAKLAAANAAVKEKEAKKAKNDAINARARFHEVMTNPAATNQSVTNAKEEANLAAANATVKEKEAKKADADVKRCAKKEKTARATLSKFQDHCNQATVTLAFVAAQVTAQLFELVRLFK